MKSLLLVGVTGLVGQSVLAQALTDPRVAEVVALTRRPLNTPAPSRVRLRNPVVDFDALPDTAEVWAADSVICTLGTTRKQAGSEAAFRKVDFDYPLSIARRARQAGAQAYALNSSLGADPRSRVFYSRTKGELEEALRTCGYPSLTFVRPGLLGGQRSEFRLGERIASLVLRLARPIVPRRYRVVPAERVAQALLEAALNPVSGVNILESEQL
ncbi:MAG TPA: NAD(P)H-binding protein [Opitutaceae bacterium]|nr:NAD(P)H-binding protein [Opitutaceae bacterium]